ncbi:guanylate kinase [Desulfobacterales bacterium HSG16]|nr:guanylate kinase [Desulfobacterales bacterium HSG16]
MTVKGRLFVVSAPSGAGKTTLCNLLLHHFTTMRYSISSTTRKPRPGEVDGIDYFFVEKQVFKQGIENGMWAECAQVHGNYYGTSADFLEAELDKGADILLDIDVQGALQIMEKFDDAVTIFIMPPDFDTLRLRLESRGTDSPAVIETRMANAEKEMAMRGRYQHIIINDNLEDAEKEFIGLVNACRADKL